MTEKNKTTLTDKLLFALMLTMHILLTLLFTGFFFTGIYLRDAYPGEGLEQMLFYATLGLEESGAGVFWDAAKIILPRALILTALLLALQYSPFGWKWMVGKKRKVTLWPIRKRPLFTLITGLLLVGLGLWQVGFFQYVYSQTASSDFIENHYVRPEYVKVTAPEKKRNLLVIEIESLETSLFTKEQGGIWDYPVIPGLYELLSHEDAVFFASDNGYKGTENVFGTTWTTASLVANTSGVPFKVPAGKDNAYHSDKFLSGAWTLGDILKENGYKNLLISGARTTFGGVKEYFTCHGDYEIIDENSLEEYGIITPESQVNEWGFSDEMAMKIARDQLAGLDGEGEPWHLFISTIDTHFTGYTYEADAENGFAGSITDYERQVENVYATTAREVSAFVKWVMEQDFYENTTVVIVGDHCNMSKYYCPDNEDVPERRARYNVILNSAVSTENTKNRSFTAMDFYPTILASAGFTVPGNRLALGTNLFSDKPTLAEEFGIRNVDKELSLRSEFYIDNIIGREDYENMEK